MASDSPLTDLHQDFIKDLQDKGRSSHTILAYGKDIAQFITHLKKNQKQTPADITPADVIAFKNSLSKDYTDKSVSRKLNSIKAFCRFLEKNHHLSTNPAAKVSGPTLKVNPPRILTPLEYRALRDAARTDTRLAAVIELLLQTGIRIGELGHLQLEDINKHQTSLTIKPYESRTGRTVPLASSARQALNLYLKNRPKSRDKTVFITKTGRPFLVRNIRSAINRLFKKAGIKNATVNDLRHTFIAAQIKAGIPTHSLAQIVGHKRITTTENYLKYVKAGPERQDIKLEEL